MSNPYVREDRALNAWIVFPSEQLRRAYVQASAAILTDGIATADKRANRLRLLIRALGGIQTAIEPKD